MRPKRRGGWTNDGLFRGKRKGPPPSNDNSIDDALYESAEEYVRTLDRDELQALIDRDVREQWD